MGQHADAVVMGLILDMQTIATGLTENASEVGALADQSPNFMALANELTQLNQEQESLKAQLEVKTADLKVKMAEAREQRTRMYALLRGTLGRKNQLLEAFGIMVKS